MESILWGDSDAGEEAETISNFHQVLSRANSSE
jgi:hypothetical protein